MRTSSNSQTLLSALYYLMWCTNCTRLLFKYETDMTCCVLCTLHCSCSPPRDVMRTRDQLACCVHGFECVHSCCGNVHVWTCGGSWCLASHGSLVEGDCTPLLFWTVSVPVLSHTDAVFTCRAAASPSCGRDTTLQQVDHARCTPATHAVLNACACCLFVLQINSSLNLVRFTGGGNYMGMGYSVL